MASWAELWAGNSKQPSYVDRHLIIFPKLFQLFLRRIDWLASAKRVHRHHGPPPDAATWQNVTGFSWRR
jgi:hypothetical protein